jgi:hypothetical protein
MCFGADIFEDVVLSRTGWIIAAFCLPAMPATPCSCISGGIGVGCQVPTADVIFLATVVSKEVVWSKPVAERPAAGEATRRPAYSGSRTTEVPMPTGGITLRVAERFHGDVGDTVVLPPDLTDCAYPFEVNHEYLVFAYHFQGRLSVSVCTATQPAKTALKTIQQLRALRDGKPLPDLFGFVGIWPADSSESRLEQVQPVPGLTVTAQGERAKYDTQTASDGTYAFRGVPAGRYRVRVEPPAGRVAFWEGSAVPDGVETNGALGSTCPVNFVIAVVK